MHDDPPMRAEVGARFYLRCEANWRLVEIIGRSCMLATVGAAVLGLLDDDVAARFLATLMARPRVKRLLSSDHFSVHTLSSMKSVKPI